jgi:glutamate racemase
VAPAGESLFVGLCCTHYGMVADRIRTALARRTARAVDVLDPNDRLVSDVVPRLLSRAEATATAPGTWAGAVGMVSKVELPEGKREAMAGLLEPVSPATAIALRAYVHVPELF